MVASPVPRAPCPVPRAPCPVCRVPCAVCRVPCAVCRAPCVGTQGCTLVVISSSLCNKFADFGTMTDVADTTEETNGESTVVICTTTGCGKPALMSCPTCIKLGLPTAPFCEQQCFKQFWSTHKLCHKVPVDPLSIPKVFGKDYPFTGTLRPAQQSPKRTVPLEIPHPDYGLHPAGER